MIYKKSLVKASFQQKKREVGANAAKPDISALLHSQPYRTYILLTRLRQKIVVFKAFMSSNFVLLAFCPTFCILVCTIAKVIAKR